MNLLSSSERLAAAMNQTRLRWAATCEAEAEAIKKTPKPPPPPLTIALSREAGANGSLVGRALGERLGWPVYDRELLQQVAEQMGLRTSLLEAVDEKRKSWLLECLEALTSAPTVSDMAFVRHLLEVMLALASHGDCVIVGRGAATALPAATTLQVRLVAPVEDRVEVIRKRRGLSKEEAAKWVEKVDGERARFVKDHFLKDPADPHRYDLILNSTRFSPPECADLIIAALHKKQARVAAR